MAEKRFLDFLDRIDGGGMGQSGDTFEGGGLLSMLGNVFASPYGSRDPERRARRDAFYAGQIGGEPMDASGFNSASVRTASELAPTPPTTYERERLNPPTAFTPVSPARDPYDMQENRYGPQAGASLPPALEASYTGRPDNPKLNDFNQAMSTVPAMLIGTEVAEMYRNFVLSGGAMPFNAFMQQQYQAIQ